MNKFPELKPTKYDAAAVLIVLLLALFTGARFYLPHTADAQTVVVTADGTEVERLPLAEARRSYQNNGYTVHVAVTAEGVRVVSANCPTQDCVRTGTITRPGESIVCLPARIVITLTGAANAPYDAIAG